MANYAKTTLTLLSTHLNLRFNTTRRVSFKDLVVL